MAKHLFYRGRVVLSIALAAIAISVYGQKLNFSKEKQPVTFSCNNLRMEDALERLSQQADVYFIYSTSVLEPNKHLTISANRQPLGELLRQIGEQTNLTFRCEGKYIVIKKNKFVEPPLQVRASAKQAAPLLAKNTPGTHAAAADSSERLTKRFYVPKDLMFTSLNSFTTVRAPLLDSTSLFNVTLPSASRVEKRWFASAGIIANNYTMGGIELRGGWKYAYGVINTAYVSESTGLYRIGYGAGTTLPLFSKMAVSLSYNYSRMKKESELTKNPVPGKSFTFEKLYQTTLKHNQAKILLQYSLTRNISLNAGASLNLLYSRYLRQTTFIAVPGSQPGDTLEESRQTRPYNPQFVISNESMPSAPDDLSLRKEVRTIKTWLSWEMGIFYRINF